jgi:hypothetical protein
MMIYIVMGDCGEYDDYREWLVVAYEDESMAQAHAAAANKESARVRQARDEARGDDGWYKRDQELAASNIYDPKMQLSYNGTGYRVYPIELAASLPNHAPTPGTSVEATSRRTR